MKTAAERVDEALVGGMVWVGRSACIALIEAAVAEDRARWRGSHSRLLAVAKILCKELSDPGTEALAAIFCAEEIERSC